MFPKNSAFTPSAEQQEYLERVREGALSNSFHDRRMADRMEDPEFKEAYERASETLRREAEEIAERFRELDK